MAKFVIAGRADCPAFARSELLADTLATSLPDFRVHKVTVHTDNSSRRYFDSTPLSMI